MAKILVVDDEPDTVALLSFILSKSGHTVVTAENGEVCLKKAVTDRPDLILLDVMMPVMDGFTAASRLSLDEETAGIPVVILTAKEGMREAFEISSNIAGYMQKPFDPHALQTRLKAILANINHAA